MIVIESKSIVLHEGAGEFDAFWGVVLSISGRVKRVIFSFYDSRL